MLKIIGYGVFILSVALAAGGILLTSKLRSRYKSDIFSTLLYYQVFIYTFGFYGLWGQAVIKMFLSLLLSPEILVRISNIEILLGLPFLVFAWLMLLKFSGSLSGRKSGNWFVFSFLLANFSILAAIGIYVAKSKISNPEIAIRYYFIAMNIIYSFIASYLIHLPMKGSSVIHERDRKIVAPLIFLIMLAQCSLLLFIDAGSWMGLIFIFIFFLGNTFLPVFFSYGTLLSSLSPAAEDKTGFEEFCRKFEVSPRESEVIMEICNGLSNKEISDKLFISLQTVKDHTHRIYLKTNVRSRVQLINFIKEFE